jgi:two-component sensor histidine kinase
MHADADKPESPPTADAAAQGVGRWRRPVAHPVAFYLSFLILACLLPALFFSGFLLVRTNTVQQDGLRTLFQANTRAVVQVVEQEVASMMTTLRVLSTDATFRSGNYADFYARAQRALIGSDTHLIVVDNELNQLMHTRVAYGAPLGSLQDRTTPRRALEGSVPVVSDVIFGQTSLRWVFYVAFPVYAEAGPPRLLILTRDVTSLAQSVGNSRLPEDWNVAVLDSMRNVVVSSDIGSMPGSAFRISFPEDMEAGVAEIENGDQRFNLIKVRSTLTQWSVVAWAPVETIRAPIWRSLAMLVMGGATIAFLAALAALFLGRKISRSAKWLSANAKRLGAGEPVQDQDHTISEFAVVSAALAEAGRNRADAENEIRLLMREVAHRSKNQLTVINAMVGQTAKNATNVEDFVDSFRRRITGLARSTDLLLANTARGIDLRALVENQIEPFIPSDPERVRLVGPRVRVDAQPAQTIGMAVHELATNAAKYGALSDDESRLDISWQRRENDLALIWREHVVRPIQPSDRKGFGSVVLERMMGGTLDADIERIMHDDGIEWRFVMPLDRLRTRDGD